MALIRIRPDVGDPLAGDHRAERHQRQAEFSNASQQAMELRLVGDLTGERRPTRIAFEAHVPNDATDRSLNSPSTTIWYVVTVQRLRYGRPNAITPAPIHPG